MILVRQEIESRNIVHPPHPHGQRLSTYDATVGKILMEGKLIEGTFTLPPRGIVWVVSNEEFHLPSDVTGLATLRTTWTHQGILALNLGVVDPGWTGQLATAIVNFSKSDFEIAKGTPFFRVIFLTHKDTAAAAAQSITQYTYLERIKTNTRLFSSTFLTMDSLIVEVADKVLGFPRWAVRLAFAAVVISMLSIIVPIVWTIVSQNYVMPRRVDELEKLPQRVDMLEKTINEIQSRTPPQSAAQKK